VIAIYCRVSTPGQEDNYSLPQQHKDGIAFAKSKKSDFKEYEDVASGKSITRIGYNALLKDIEAKKLNSVWIATEDRFSRDATLGLQFLDLLVIHQMRLFVGTQEFDPKDENTRFIISIKFLVAEFEWSQIKNRMRRGRIAHANQGKRIYNKIYGYEEYYTEQGERRLRVNDFESKVVLSIYQDFMGGCSLRRIARLLNSEKIKTKKYGEYRKNRKTQRVEKVESEWTANQIKKILVRPEYISRTWNWEHTELLQSPTIPSLIENQIWEEVQGRIVKLNNHKGHDGIRTTDHELSGICKCAKCGAKYYFHYDPRKKSSHYWHTVGSIERQECKNKPHYMKMIELENVLRFTYSCIFQNSVESLRYISQQEEAFESENESLIAQKDNTADKLLDVEKKIKNLIGFIESQGISEDISTALDERRREKKSLLEQLSVIEANLSHSETELLDQVKAYREERLQAFLNGDGATKRSIYLETIQSALVEQGKLTVTYTNGKQFKIALGKNNNSVYLIDIYFGKEFQTAVDFNGLTSQWTYNRERFDELFNAPITKGHSKKETMDVLFILHKVLIEKGDGKSGAIEIAFKGLTKDYANNSQGTAIHETDVTSSSK
jgi:DNA invertase Pin-like site-specific DNA recombinase